MRSRSPGEQVISYSGTRLHKRGDTGALVLINRNRGRIRIRHEDCSVATSAMTSEFILCGIQIRKTIRPAALSALPAILCLVCSLAAWSQQLPWSQRVANSAIARWPAGRLIVPNVKWASNHELATLLNGMDAVWYNTANGVYYRYVRQSVDPLVAPDGSMPSYDPAANPLENIALGRQLLLLYCVTQDARYYKAATLLHKQLSAQLRNTSGDFSGKQVYPDQMWSDGPYMAEPFYAEYASIFQEPQDFAEITRLFSMIEEHTRSSSTGLLYDASDESRKPARLDKTAGTTRIFSARGSGWYMMALVDSLSYYPENDPGRATLLAILNRAATAVVRYQDQETGLWYQALDKPGERGNYLESSGSCMFTYAMQKGVRLGYLPQHYSENATRAWQGILGHFVQTDANGSVTIAGTVKGIGLGGNPDHDESYAHYVSPPLIDNDPEGVGAFLLASSEMETAPAANVARGETVIVDAWFNSQQRINAAGQSKYFHYKWDDYSDSGFSMFGHIFASYGATLDTLYRAPTMERLKQAQYYIIVSADIPAKNPHPNYVQPEDAEQVAEWVNQGGVLVLMENDPANADIEHLDLIADRFGIHFNNVLSHHVIGDQFAAGQITVTGGGPFFHDPHTLYMKDTCTISLKAPAMSLLEDKGDIMMAVARYGKGTVFAVVDPWLYNEYTDGRKLPPEQDNYAAGKEFVGWLLRQTRRNSQRSSQP